MVHSASQRAAAAMAAPAAAFQVARPTAPARRPAARRVLAQPPLAAANGASGPEWFQRTASSARSKLEEWAKRERIGERVASSLEAASRAAQQAGQEAQKTYKQVDSQYDVSGKAADAARKAAEAARNVNDAAEDMDSRFQFRARVRNLWKDVKRKTPQVLRGVQDFFNTPLGAVTFLFLFLISVFTGAFWVILRWVFAAMWMSVLLGPLIINYLNAKAMQEQQEQYREYLQEQQRRQQNPFYGTPFEDLFSGSSGPRASRFGGKTTKASTDDVIDVSFEHIDD